MGVLGYSGLRYPERVGAAAAVEGRGRARAEAERRYWDE